MKFVRFVHKGQPTYGIVEGRQIRRIEGDIFGDYRQTDELYPMAEAKILTPCCPSKIVGIGLNYADHTKEFGEAIPAEPKIFLKPTTAAIAHGETIVLPPQSARVDFEAELALVIKKKTHCVSPEEADDYLFGCTCLNDVTARDLQSKDGQWTRAKGFDTFAPFGPCIETEADPDQLPILLRLNGVVKQRSNTKYFLHDVRSLISFVSSIMTLMPGDIISTGTPAGIGPMADGDEVSVEIEGVGILINYVKNGQ